MPNERSKTCLIPKLRVCSVTDTFPNSLKKNLSVLLIYTCRTLLTVFCEQHVYSQFVLFFCVVFLFFFLYYFWLQSCEAESFLMHVCCPLIHASMHATDKLRRCGWPFWCPAESTSRTSTRLPLLHMNCLLMTKGQAFVFCKY